MSFEINLIKTTISFVGLDFKRQKYEKYQKKKKDKNAFTFCRGTTDSPPALPPAGSVSADSR